MLRIIFIGLAFIAVAAFIILRVSSNYFNWRLTSWMAVPEPRAIL